MLKYTLPGLVFGLTLGLQVGQARAGLLVTTRQPDQVVKVDDRDLAQTSAITYSASGPTELFGFSFVASPGGVDRLFDGRLDVHSNHKEDKGGVKIMPRNSVTVVFDVSTHPAGYDITGIETVAGWKSFAKGRSNQGYAILLTFVDGRTATLVDTRHWEPNTPPTYWTTVSFSNPEGGPLFSDTVQLNQEAATRGTSVRASGVKSITFKNFSPGNAGHFAVYREFDIRGVPSTDGPGTGSSAAERPSPSPRPSPPLLP